MFYGDLVIVMVSSYLVSPDSIFLIVDLSDFSCVSRQGFTLL